MRRIPIFSVGIEANGKYPVCVVLCDGESKHRKNPERRTFSEKGAASALSVPCLLNISNFPKST